MSELPYAQTFKLIESAQPKEFQGLFLKTRQLLDTAYREHTLPEISKNPHLLRFSDDIHVQSLWEIENDSLYQRDRLAINMGRDALWISIGYSDLQPNRGLTIGEHYAYLDAHTPLRAQSTDWMLRNDLDKSYFYHDEYVVEQLAQFTTRLDTSIALMGLTYAIRQPEVMEVGAAKTPTVEIAA